MEAALVPVVLSPLSLSALLDYVLSIQTSSTLTSLIICSSRETFLFALSRSLDQDNGGDADNLQRLMSPTLHNLVTARHVNVAFCASVQALLAYLTAYGATKHALDAREEKGRIVLVNPLALHAPTPSFSAQGLSRTFATAAETALRLRVQLLVVECLGAVRATNVHDETEEDEVAAAMARDEEPHETENIDQDPWEQEVPVLNVSVRRYGLGGAERAWAGRTIKVKRIASRWFRFDESERKSAVGQGGGG
ncbi:hypothetical protein B0J11DRAFT_115722 [Dendryphion nanum]|uniref:Elongator complex protein 5 n=1 Tax=Dendryphion nanum TaxID=256645 RepID=A0A9P9DBC1_9PLEO|nr:hypothetical protein B0J11DRAFT_115722 [Dendryphion nanum]